MKLSLSHQDLFPTRIWQVDFGFLSRHFAAWEAAIAELRRQDTKAWGSNRHGWNSPKTILQNDLFAPLSKAIHACMAGAFRDMGGLPTGVSFGLSGWANVLDRGGFNTLHLHQNVLLSGCFYLTVPEGASPIVFRDPRAGTLLSPFRQKGVNVYSEATVQPRAGLLVIFPNWLEHRVEPHEADVSRISIAVNAGATGRRMPEAEDA